MKKFAILIVIATMTLITGCGNKQIKEATAISETGILVYQSFDDVYGIIKDNISAFSPRDVVRLQIAGEIIADVKAKIYSKVIKKGSISEMVNDLPDLIPLFERAKTAYLMASDVVMDEIDEFDREGQITLYTFQDTCYRLDAIITNAITEESARNDQLVRDIIIFVVLVGKIAVPLIMI